MPGAATFRRIARHIRKETFFPALGTFIGRRFRCYHEPAFTALPESQSAVRADIADKTAGRRISTDSAHIWPVNGSHCDPPVGMSDSNDFLKIHPSRIYRRVRQGARAKRTRQSPFPILLGICINGAMQASWLEGERRVGTQSMRHRFGEGNDR